jgi:hypothetical protein
MDIFLESLIGVIVWTLANVIYVDLRRKGIRRGRVIAFFVGWPGTFLSLFVVPEGVTPRFNLPNDDDERLLREIRVDRELWGEGAAERGGVTHEWVGEEEPEAPPRV